MNPEYPYPYPNWKGRPLGDPTETIMALRQCRKVRSVCYMPNEVSWWAGHYHGMTKKAYRRLLGERLDALYGWLEWVPMSLEISSDSREIEDAKILWRALVAESRIYGRPAFYGNPPLPQREGPRKGPLIRVFKHEGTRDAVDAAHLPHLSETRRC